MPPIEFRRRIRMLAVEPARSKIARMKRRWSREPYNTALVSVTQNRDYPLYDWATRHSAVLDYTSQNPIELAWIGDSIVHRFGGAPTDGTPTTGQPVWEEFYGDQNAVNLGFGYDRTENVLWRIEHGQLDGIQPKLVVVLIGTNNLSVNSVEETHAGVLAVVDAVRSKQPSAPILLLGILPRGEGPGDRMRKRAAAVNELLAATELEGVTYFDAGSGLVEPNGRIKRSTMPDFLHPTEGAYRVIATNIKPVMSKLLTPWALQHLSTR